MPRRRELALRSKLARQIITAMLEQALREGTSCETGRAEELGQLARRIAKSMGVKIPRRYKWFYCKRCKRLLIPGKTMRVRVRQNREPHITLYCSYCGSFRRIYFKRKKRSGREKTSA